MKDCLSKGKLLNKGRYSIVRHIATGGQSIVYEACDNNLESRVVVKQTYSDEDWAHRAIKREAKFLIDLHHQCLPKVLDLFSEEGSAFLVMSFIEGEDLDEVLKRKADILTVEDVLGWAQQLLDVIEYLHAQTSSIIHRDIKPQNVRLASDGRLFLLDFGIAKETTTAGLVTGGSLHYASPEQLEDRDTDVRSDLYSLAATVYYLLTGVEPADALERGEAINKGEADLLRSATELNPKIPLYLANALTQAMSLLPEDRPPSVQIMRALLSKNDQYSVLGDDKTKVRYRAGSVGSPSRRSNPIVINILKKEKIDSEKVNEFLQALQQGERLAPGLLSVIIDLLETPKQLRKEKLRSHSNLLSSARVKKQRVPLDFIKHLVAGDDPSPETILRIRKVINERRVNTESKNNHSEVAPSEGPSGSERENLDSRKARDKVRRSGAAAADVDARLIYLLNRKGLKIGSVEHDLHSRKNRFNELFAWGARGCLLGAALLGLSLLIFRIRFLLESLRPYRGFLYLIAAISLLGLFFIVRHGNRSIKQEKTFGVFGLGLALLTSGILTFLLIAGFLALFS